MQNNRLQEATTGDKWGMVQLFIKVTVIHIHVAAAFLKKCKRLCVWFFVVVVVVVFCYLFQCCVHGC